VDAGRLVGIDTEGAAAVGLKRARFEYKARSEKLTGALEPLRYAAFGQPL
jgi:hypothetical protein